MENKFSSLKIKLEGILLQTKTLINIKSTLKLIEAKLPKIGITGKLRSTETKKDINTKIKNMHPKIKIDAETSKAEKKINALGKKHSSPTLQPTIDNTQINSGLKEIQSFFNKFSKSTSGGQLIRMSVQNIVQSISQAIANIKELDTLKTKLQISSGISDSSANSTMQLYNTMAKKLSATTSDIAEAANQFLQMGEDISTANNLIQSSYILSKTGMIENADAVNYLLSCLKGYGIAAESAMDVVSKFTAVDEKAAISAGGLAEAVSKCANTANQSGTSINRLVGYAAAIGEAAQQPMSTVGTSLAEMYAQMNKIKTGVPVSDQTGESLNDTINLLSSLGIHLQNNAGIYKSFDQILDDISSKWNGMTETEQTALSTAIAGADQLKTFTALMDNYSKAIAYSETAANSAGNAMGRFQVYQNSIEAKRNELTASLESLSTNLISEELYSGILKATTGIVKFLDTTNLLKGTLAGFTALKLSKFFASIGTGIITAVKNTEQLTSAMTLFASGKTDANLKNIGKQCIGLKDSQLKLILSTKGLSEAERLTILEGMKVEKSKRAQKLATLGLAESEKTAAKSAYSYKGAIKSLGTAINNLIMAHPILTTIATMGAAFWGISKIYDAVNVSSEEAKEKTEELISGFTSAMETANSHKTTIKELETRYIELSKGVNHLGETTGLTTEEANEYHEICNKIADLFPELVNGYTHEGNAILKLKGNVESLTKAYEAETLAAYASLTASDKNSDANNIILDWKYSLSEDKGNGTNIIRAIKELEAFATSDINAKLYTSLKEKADLGIYDDMNDTEKLISGSAFLPYKIKLDINKDSVITDEELAKAKHSAMTLLNTYKTELNNNFSSVKTLANAYLMTNPDYMQLDKPTQNAASLLINSIPANSDIAQVLMTQNTETLESYVNFIVQTLSSESSPVKNALHSLLTLETDTLPVSILKSQVDTYVKIIADILHEDPADLKIRLGFDDTETNTMLGKAKAKLKSEFTSKADMLNIEELKIASDLKIPNDTLLSWDELMAMIQEVKETSAKSNLSSMTELFHSADFASAKEKLLELAKSGELTPATLSSTEEYTKLLIQTGLSANEATSKILDMLSMQEKLSASSKGMDKLKSSYEEFKNLGFVTAASLEALPDVFKKLSGFKLFSQIAGNPSQGNEEIQQAFNEIIKQYLVAQNTLSSLTKTSDDELQIYTANLKQMGITNAEDVINQIRTVLGQENQLINKAEAEYMTYLLNKDTTDTNYLQNVSSKNSQLALALGAPYQTDYNNWCSLLTKKSEAYNEFVRKIGDSYNEHLSPAQNLIANGKEVNTMNLQEYYTYKSAADTAAIEAQKMSDILKIDLSTVSPDFKTSFSPTSSDSSPTSGSSAESAAKETAETFNFIETLLSRLSDQFNRLKTAGENTFKSLAARAGAYNAALNVVKSQITAQTQAYDTYMSKANEVGLDEYWAAQVRDGSISITDVADEGLKQKIKDYQSWYEKALACRSALEDLNRQETELKQAKIELVIARYDSLLEKLSGRNDRIQNKIGIKEAWGFTAGKTNYATMNKNIMKQIDYTAKQEAELKKLLPTVEKTSQAWYEYNKRLDANRTSQQELKKAMAENAKAAAALAGEKAAAKAEKYDAKNELYDAKIDNAVSAKSKNKQIDKKISQINKKDAAYQNALKTDKKNLSGARKNLSNWKSTKENKSLLKKIRKYTKAQKRIPKDLLDKAYKLKDNGKLYNACLQYNSYFDAVLADKETADLFKETAKQEKADLAMEKFNNISTEYDQKMAANQQKKTSIQNQIALAEEQGHSVSTSHYKNLISAESAEQKKQEEKRKTLQNAMNKALADGSIKKGSEEWYSMAEAINEVTNAIDESTKSLAEYNNALRQLQWDAFDAAMETAKRTNSEADFYLNLMDSEKMTDEDGSLTKYGSASLHLHQAKYGQYIAQAKAYQKEYQELLATGDLNDNNVIARLRELEDAYRDALLSAREENNSVIDLIRGSYDAQLESLSGLISKFKDLKQNEKDAYEYQKNIAEKTKNIASLQKQLQAYGANDTEEARAKVQKLKVELDAAQEELKETEYDKYLSDTGEMLDSLYNEYEALVDEKFNDTNELLEKLNTSSETAASTITTLNELLAGVSSDGSISVSLKNAIENPDDVQPPNPETENGGAPAPTPESQPQPPAPAGNAPDLIQAVERRTPESTLWNNFVHDTFNFPERANTSGKNIIPESARISAPSHNNSAVKEIWGDPIIDSSTHGATRVSNPSAQNFSVNLGGITVNGVNDPEEFGRQLRNEIANNGKTAKLIAESTSSLISPRGSGNTNLWK